ncbi:ECF-type sigma factor [Ideonella sp. DXS29W]|uniref:ECF-type sigma factor n=1 Tax=Ideonella lacteola TaxID=2984193 RepID=A0ABU9BIB1_9BURK
MNDSDIDIVRSVAPPTHDPRFASLYAELHRVAHREARRYGGISELSATTVLHEAYLNLSQRGPVEFRDQAHFIAYAARVMRGLVIDQARARGAIKRGGQAHITVLDAETAEEMADPQSLQSISDALDDLARLEPDLAHIVDLRFFCGFTMDEIAAQRGASVRTVQRQWDKARALLYRAMTTD